MEKKHHIYVVVGPTASGKSDYAVELAHSLSNGVTPFIDGEIVSADSKQIYSGLSIGTGTILPEEMKGIPHHMLGIIEPGASFSVAEYQKLALPIVMDIISRGKTPIICGGTGQYIDSLIYTTSFPVVPPNTILREELETYSTEELFARLVSKDKERASTIDTHNRVRLIRALEIVEVLGNVPLLTAQGDKELRFLTTMYLLTAPKELLVQRIEKRLEKRLQGNDETTMLSEAKMLRTKNLPDKAIASLGLEYKWMNIYRKGECSYDEMKKHILTDSWHYAKRQMTWNKKYEGFAEKVQIEK